MATLSELFPLEPLKLTQDVVCPSAADHLANASNAIALDTYGSAFDEICTSKAILDLDLEAIEIGARVPVLKNGANKYFETSSEPAIFQCDRFIERGLRQDCYLIIPEAANIAAEFIPSDWDPTTALRSISSALDRIEGLHVAELGSMPPSSALRFFDSHLSVPFYWRACENLVTKYGFNHDITYLHCSFRPYRCDLGSRFSTESPLSLFVSNRFFESESSGELQSGKRRIFVNPSAPNAKHLLLIGDSHSYSVMSHIFSHYFRKVTFYWANRANGYASLRNEIELIAQEADFFIEETSERFFLRNFTTKLAKNCVTRTQPDKDSINDN